MAMKTPKVFTVGTGDQYDFTPDAIELLTLQVRDWFASDACDRTYADPLAEARDQIEQCLQATTKKGKIWAKAPDSFEARVKIKTLFDMQEGNHVAQDVAKNPVARRNKEHQEAIDVGNSAVTMTHIQQYQEDMERMILDAYPELDNPVHRPNVVRLAMLYAEQENVRLELKGATGSKRRGKIETLSTLQKTITETMKSLDIYPDQIRKRMDKQREGSVGDLVALIDEDMDFRAREKRWALTLALQLWWMTKHPDGKNSGPQIHDWEMWHLTRTRPIDYKCACGKAVTLVEGFTPEELQQYLISEGVLIEKPILPNYMTEEELNGLASFTSAESTPSDGENLEATDSGGEETSEGLPGSEDETE